MSRASSFAILAAAALLLCLQQARAGTAVVSLYRRNATLDNIAARASRNVAVSALALHAATMRLRLPEVGMGGVPLHLLLGCPTGPGLRAASQRCHMVACSADKLFAMVQRCCVALPRAWPLLYYLLVS